MSDGCGKTEELTIDELARRTGMTVRNIRAHQSRGLLPAPQVRGRTGFYGPEHESRIKLIRELQADGFKLEAIGRLLDSAGGSSEEVLRFTRAVKAPFEDETPQIVTAEELGGALGRRRRGSGAAAQGGEARHPAPAARRQLRGAEPAARTGQRRAGRARDPAPRRRSTSRRSCASTRPRSRRSSSSCSSAEVWKPFEDQGSPETDLPAVRDALERLRPLASDALLAMFQLVMTEAVEERMGREVERIEKRRR